MAMTIVLKVVLQRIITRQVCYIYRDEKLLKIPPKVIMACNLMPIDCNGKSNIAIQYCCFYSINT